MQPKSKKMKTVSRLAMILIVLLAVSCGGSTKNEKSTVTDKRIQLQKLKDQQAKTALEIRQLEEEIARLDPASVEVKPRLVTVTPVNTQNFAHYIDLQGRIDAENIAFVTPRGQGGQVKAIYVKEGSPVRKGQLLIKLDDALPRQQIEQVKVQLDLAKSLYQRRKNLWDQNIGTEVEVLQAKSNMDNLEKQLDLAKEQLNMTNVYAEMSGVADMVNLKVGEFFSPVTASQAGIRIVNSSTLKAVVDIPENYLSRVKQGTPVIISVPDAGKTFNSKVSLISQVINVSSRGFSVEAKIPSSAGLKPNQVANVRIQDYSASNVIVVPVSTVQTDEKGKYVYVLATENGKKIARKKQVSIGELNGDDIEIKAGLAAGDQLITEGHLSLYDGQSITTEVK